METLDLASSSNRSVGDGFTPPERGMDFPDTSSSISEINLRAAERWFYATGCAFAMTVWE
jgi:hypothetical protein